MPKYRSLTIDLIADTLIMTSVRKELSNYCRALAKRKNGELKIVVHKSKKCKRAK